MAIDCAVQQAFNRGQFPVPTDQIRLSTPDSMTPLRHAQEPLGAGRLMGSFDADTLHFTESRSALNQPRCRLTQHHPAGRGDRLHPLRQPDLLADRGVCPCVRTDFAGNHPARVQSDPQLQPTPSRCCTSSASRSASS